MAKVPDRIGQLVGERYEFLDIIGRGGQGIVYRALDRWQARSVAVKVLGSKALREPHVVERLMREQQAMTALKGTSAVELFDVCRGHDGELCLVMELLTGMDLDDCLFNLEQQHAWMSLQRVCEVFAPIVSTLEVAHAAGIVHRDLKPANVFLLDGGGVRLLDFGLSRLRNSAPLTAAGTVMGSPSFMAPEAWQGVSDLLDQRVDVYSLGVILFRVLTGELPFGGATMKEKFLSSTTGKRPSLLRLRPDLAPTADDWVAGALAVHREQRFSNVAALWHGFQSILPAEAKRGLSFWAAAKSALQKVRGPSEPAPAPRPKAAPPRLPELTMQLRDDELQAFAPPPRNAPPPRKAPPPRDIPPPRNASPPREETISMGDSDLLPDSPGPVPRDSR